MIRYAAWLQTLIALAAIAALPFPGTAQLAPADADTVGLAMRDGSRLWLEGDSNLHPWSCEAQAITPEVIVSRREPTSNPDRIRAAQIIVPVAGIECGNRRMNSNLFAALDAEHHGEIRFIVSDASFVDTGVQGFLAVDVTGTLTVKGVSQPITLTVTGSDTGDGGLRVQGRVAMRLTDYGIEPPTALMGLLKTSNDVVVLFDIVFDYADVEGRLRGW